VAPLWRSGPTCFVNELDGPLLNGTQLDRINDWANRTFWPIIDRINQSLAGSNCNLTESGNRKCDVFDYGTLVHFPVDHCGITEDCKIEMDEAGEPTLNPVDDGMPTLAGLTRWRIPLVSYSALWALYKFVFLPFHPIDRAYRIAMGNPTPPPQPVFKLLTEPYFEGCGKPVNFFMNKVSMVGKIIRYSLLPNSLLLPIITLRSRRKCPGYVHYTYDKFLGGFIYYFIVLDLIHVLVMYVLGITVKGGKCIKTLPYRCHKLWWFLSLNVAVILWVADLFIVLNFRFWEGIHLQIRLFFTIALNPNITVDFLQLLGTASIFFDGLQFTIMVLSILCPFVLKKVPGFRDLMKDDMANAPEGDESQQLLGAQSQSTMQGAGP